MRALKMAAFAASLLVAASSARVAGATIVTLEFTATVIDDVAEGGFDGSISLGSPVQGRFVYDDEAAPYVVFPELQTSWTYFLPESELEVEVGGYELSPWPIFEDDPATRGFLVFITNSEHDDSFYFTAQGTDRDETVPGDEISFALVFLDSTGGALTSMDLTQVPLDLSVWSEALVRFSVWNSQSNAYASVRARVETLDVTRTVPEPGAASALAFALFPLLAARRRYSGRALRTAVRALRRCRRRGAAAPSLRTLARGRTGRA